jgi:sugar/nucleoside kinase (ribokinase family)
MIAVIGSITADLFIKSTAPLTGLSGDGFRSSNLIFTEAPITVSIGGNGGNSAYVLAGLGAPTALYGTVGRDTFGDYLLNVLGQRGVDVGAVIRSPRHATSTSTIIMSDTSNQVVFHHLGSTACADFDANPSDRLASIDALLISGYPLMTQLRGEGFAAALARVRAVGGITALDVGPAIGEPVTLSEITPLLPNVDYLIANTHELEVLIGVEDWQHAAQQVMAAGATRIVVKQGHEGVTAFTPGDQVHVDAFSIAANISVGAGDSFNAGLIYGLQQRWPLPSALRFANAVAALVVSGPRGVLDSPTLTQVEAFLDDNP